VSQGWHRLVTTWSRLDRRVQQLAVAILAATVLAWLSSPLYLLGVIAATGAAVLVQRFNPGHRWGRPAAAAVLVLAVVLLGLSFQGVADPAPRLPDRPAALALSLPPTQHQVQALIAADPGSPDTWTAAGFVLPRQQPTDAGVVALERVLLMDPSQSRAALALAQAFLSFGAAPTQLDQKIAAYYTAVAGYPAPDLGREP
jgi:hypothetical protein